MAIGVLLRDMALQSCATSPGARAVAGHHICFKKIALLPKGLAYSGDM